MGPLADPRGAELMQRQIDEARAHGAEVACGGCTRTVIGRCDTGGSQQRLNLIGEIDRAIGRDPFKHAHALFEA